MLAQDMYKNTHNSIIQKSPKLETQHQYSSIGKWMNKCSNTYALENYTACKWSTTIQSNMDNSHRQNVKWMLHKSAYCELLFI